MTLHITAVVAFSFEWQKKALLVKAAAEGRNSAWLKGLQGYLIPGCGEQGLRHKFRQ